MDTPDAIPSDDACVVIPEPLLEILRETVERRLHAAFDLAFPPDRRDAVIDAVHLLDAFDADRLTARQLTVLLVDTLEHLLQVARDLIKLRDRLDEPGRDASRSEDRR
jgi:hypothetical protein